MEIADELLEIIPRLLGRIRADIPRDTDDLAPEWRDILALRATKGQIKLLRVLMSQQCCTMQELADQLDVAPPMSSMQGLWVTASSQRPMGLARCSQHCGLPGEIANRAFAFS